MVEGTSYRVDHIQSLVLQSICLIFVVCIHGSGEELACTVNCVGVFRTNAHRSLCRIGFEKGDSNALVTLLCEKRNLSSFLPFIVDEDSDDVHCNERLQ